MRRLLSPRLTSERLEAINRSWAAKRRRHTVRFSAKAQEAEQAGRPDARYFRYTACPLCRSDECSVLHDRTTYGKHGLRLALAASLTSVLGVHRANIWVSRLLGRGINLNTKGYRVMQCVECGFIFRNPTYTEEGLNAAYNHGNYGSFLSGEYARQREKLYAYIYDRIELDRRTAHFPRRRVLDFGCGFGLFLNFMRSRGWEPYGFDYSSDSIALGLERFGLENIRSGTLDESAVDGDYDLVSMISVVAHLTDPLDTFSRIHRILRPGGGLLIWTVNAGSFQHRRTGAGWHGYSPNHLVFFDQQSMTRALTQAGFTSVEFACDRRGFNELASRGAIRERDREALQAAYSEQNLGEMLLVYATNGVRQA